MEFKDYYATLGVERSATQAEIKRAYRKLARKYHPDVSKEANAEARFKEVAEAHEALIDPERRAAYDDIGQRHERGQPFEPPPGWDSGFEFSGGGAEAAPGGHADFSDFFESLFGRQAGRSGGPGGPERQRRPATGPRQAAGDDHHARVVIDLEDSYRGAPRTVTLRMPAVDASGRMVLQDRQLEVQIPRGVRPGQHLRLAGQGGPGEGGAAAGDLYLEVDFRPQTRFRLDGRDVYVDLPLAPWEAALGAVVTAPTPEGPVSLTVPAASVAGRKLRLKGKGLPGTPPGDLYAVLGVALPPPLSEAAKAAYGALARAFPGYDARAESEAARP
jgi:curved DNA-binding protein